MTNNPYDAPQSESAPPPSGKGAKYKTYDEVPFFRKQWFFWLSWLIFAPVALVILFSGDVYYRKKGEVVSFGTANKVVGAVFCFFWIFRVYLAVTENN
jgi:hypothetical protein